MDDYRKVDGVERQVKPAVSSTKGQS